MTVFGLTGGTGTGKTTALNTIRDLGGLVIDCDEVYHGLTQTSAEMLSGIEARFPGTVVNGVLQRKALGAVVFSDEAALKDLNAITHGFVCRNAFYVMQVCRSQSNSRKGIPPAGFHADAHIIPKLVMDSRHL